MLEAILEVLYRPITQRLEALVADVAALSAKIDEMQSAVNSAKIRIEQDVDELRRLLEERVDPEDLDPLIEKLDALTANVQAIDPNPEFPAEEQPEPQKK